MANVILFIILLLIVGQILFQKMRVKKAAKIVDATTFKEGACKAQIVDVRERNIFKRSHILGARSLPMSQFRESLKSLRKDHTVYLYEDREILAGRAAVLLKKAGFTEIYILKKGYAAWNGKIKTKEAR
ncbi:MAG: rhodanese-like domain-containing protein [Streptococcaceae bacterium]|nr:rhodanese-like domain-containing protein [Streptococcaceae bacterium]